MTETLKRKSRIEYEEMLQEAINALNAPSEVLQNAPKMSMIELGREIDERIEKIQQGKMKKKEMDQIKAEARTLAILRLRRGY